MKKGDVRTTPDQIRTALQKTRLLPEEPSLESIRYYGPEQLFVLTMSNGRRRFIPREELQGLGEAKKRQLSNIEIVGPGTGVYWPDLDISFGVSQLLDGIYGTKEWMKRLAHPSRTTFTVEKVKATYPVGVRRKPPLKHNEVLAPRTQSKTTGEKPHRHA